jgi:hypothetical protein
MNPMCEKCPDQGSCKASYWHGCKLQAELEKLYNDKERMWAWKDRAHVYASEVRQLRKQVADLEKENGQLKTNPLGLSQRDWEILGA